MFTRILYATDGSKGALSAARFLASLPHRRDAHVHIVTVLPLDDDRDADALLVSAQAALGCFPGHVTTAIARGSSTSEIVDIVLATADYAKADMIAVGASGHSAIARVFLGSVAEWVARRARQPVLVTRPQLAPLREVIVGIDGSDDADAAAVFAASQIPLPLVCTIRLASVIPQPVFGVVGDPLYPGAPDFLTLEMVNREATHHALAHDERLSQTLRSLPGSARIDVEPIALGHPVPELVRIADEHSAGLIVVGSHGLTGIERFLLGSVSERVLHHAHCSVLIVKPPAKPE